MKPIIGIVSKYVRSNNTRENALIRDEVKNAIIENGGIAIGILSPQVDIKFFSCKDKEHFDDLLSEEEKKDFITQINMCDGIVLQGGVNSMKYESWIAKYTYDHDIPTLGICGGQNAMVRGVGGTIKRIDNVEKHNQKWVDEVHDVYINKNSKFYKIVKCEKMNVNSRHKKTIANPSEKYDLVGVCEDGYFDVIEAKNKRFNIGVRFHPESLYKKYETHNAIFKAFIDACKEER